MMRKALQFVSTAAIVVCAFWNIGKFDSEIAGMRLRDADALVVMENRYSGMRESLLGAGFTKGTVEFITNRDLTQSRRTEDDDAHWGEAQYIMAPLVLQHSRRTLSGGTSLDKSPYVLGDFWDNGPIRIPDDLTPIRDSGSGVILFRKKSIQ